MDAMTEYAKQLGAFVVLVVVQSAAILLFKLCQQHGKYTFNPPRLGVSTSGVTRSFGWCQ